MDAAYMITFPTTHNAIQAEKVLLERGLAVRVMPMPAAVSAGCGICLRLPVAQALEAEKALTENDVAVEAWYIMSTRDGRPGFLLREP